MSSSCTDSYTLIVPVKNEPPEITQRIREQTQTLFKGSVTVIIVDDGSWPPHPGADIRHSVSRGYGAALKAGVEAAHSTWVVTCDGDGQHRPRDVQRLIEATQDFPGVDMWVGDRRLHEPSLKRYFGRKFLNWVAGVFAWRNIPDLNSGLRIFRRDIAHGYREILCDGFSYTTSLTLSMLADNYTVDWLPIQVAERSAGSSHVRVLRDGWVTLRYIFVIGMALRTRRLRATLRRFYR